MNAPEVHSPAAVAQQLAAQLTQALALPADATHHGKLGRVEVRVEKMPAPLEWLRAQPAAPVYYWSGRDDDFTMAGVGEADVLVPMGPADIPGLFRHMRARLRAESPSLRYYGGFRFHGGPVRGERWKAFKEYRFVVPRFELLRRGDSTVLACNFRRGSEEGNARELSKALRELATLQFNTPPRSATLPKIVDRTDLPDAHGWAANVQDALEACATNEIEKVVLAREVTLRGEHEFDPLFLLSKLLEQSSSAFDMCFCPAPGRAFIGVSPERLYRRTNIFIESDALAGTRPRGKSDAEDTALAKELLRSEKDLREHRFVARTVREHLRRFCTEVHQPDAPSLMELRHCRHLHTPIEGILKDPLCDAALIENLHPTPAVGGCPRDAALAWLEKHEPFDRGVYAGPVGWVGYDATEFSVAIRSGLIRGEELSLYSGAGIVPGSQPEAEWAEIENKIASFMTVLNDAPR